LEVRVHEVVVSVLHHSGHDAGRGGGHERLGEWSVGHQGALGLDFGRVPVADLGDGGRRGHQTDLTPPAAGEGLEIGVVERVAFFRPASCASEAGDAVLDIRDETLPGLLTVVANVDPDRDLGRDHLRRGDSDGPAEFLGLDGLAKAASPVQLGQLGWPRQAAGMCRQDPLVASKHCRPCRSNVPGRYGSVIAGWRT
jgi:hypothetical protein